MSEYECRKTGLLKEVPYSMFVFYKIATFVPAFAGIYAIYMFGESLGWVIGYLLVFMIHVSIVYRLKCTHCSYYKNPGRSLKCMWLWGMPKIFNDRPGPESAVSKAYIPFGMAVVAFFPVYWLLNSWILLVLYFVSIAVLVSALFLFTCSKCTFFDCAHNRVSGELKEAYSADQALDEGPQGLGG